MYPLKTISITTQILSIINSHYKTSFSNTSTTLSPLTLSNCSLFNLLPLTGPSKRPIYYTDNTPHHSVGPTFSTPFKLKTPSSTANPQNLPNPNSPNSAISSKLSKTNTSRTHLKTLKLPKNTHTLKSKSKTWSQPISTLKSHNSKNPPKNPKAKSSSASKATSPTTPNQSLKNNCQKTQKAKTSSLPNSHFHLFLKIHKEKYSKSSIQTKKPLPIFKNHKQSFLDWSLQKNSAKNTHNIKFPNKTSKLIHLNFLLDFYSILSYLIIHKIGFKISEYKSLDS